MVNDDGTPGLDGLRRELEEVGMVVVPFRDEIHVRRSTLEYIKVRVDGGILRCQSCIGFSSQVRATWTLIAVEAIAIPAFLLEFGATGVGLVAAFAGLLGFGFHALRYTLDEVAINRIQSVWLNLRERHRMAHASSPMSLPSPTSLSLPAGAGSAQAVSRPHHVRTPD